MNTLRPPLILPYINLRAGQMFINTLLHCVHQLLPRIERLRPDLTLKVKQEQIWINLGFWSTFWQYLGFFFIKMLFKPLTSLFFLLSVLWTTYETQQYPPPSSTEFSGPLVLMFISISVELNYISLWPALCFSLLEGISGAAVLGESPGPPHSVPGSCWWVLGYGCEEQQVWMDLHQTARGAVTSLWDLMHLPSILRLAGFRAGLTSVPSHLPVSPSLGLLPRSSTI